MIFLLIIVQLLCVQLYVVRLVVLVVCAVSCS